MTACELHEVAALTNNTERYVYYQQSWMCRGVAEGFIAPDLPNRKFELFVAALFVALLQALPAPTVPSPLTASPSAPPVDEREG